MSNKRQQLSAFTQGLPATSRLRACETAIVNDSKKGANYALVMDIIAIPKMHSVCLMGLDFSMRPENVRFETDHGFIQPLPEQVVIQRLKSLAILVYNQEKYTPEFHDNVCQDSNIIAYFLCAMHRQAAPQPQKKKSRHSSVSSVGSNSSQSSCKSEVPRKNCELPPLATSSMLPLGYWDSLYYALVAEVRALHGDLQERYGWGVEKGTEVVHNYGVDGCDKHPVTPIEIAVMLENTWYALMDTRLIATLDDAVRMRKFKIAKAQATLRGRFIKDSDGNVIFERPPIIQGIVDINGMSVDEITEMLWSKHAPEVDQACSENFEDESMFTARRAERHAQTTAQSAELEANAPTKAETMLPCGHCADYCKCKGVAQDYNSLADAKESNISDEQATEHLKQEAEAMNHATATNTNIGESEMQMRRARHAPGLTIDTNAMTKFDEARQVSSRNCNRSRAGTNDSRLANVPDAKPGRGKVKDVFPLGLYNSGSPGRYPRMRGESSASGQTSSTTNTRSAPRPIPNRKPVPAAHTGIPSQPYVAPDSGNGVITPPHENRYLPGSLSPKDPQVWYQQKQKVFKQQNVVTQSFSSTALNPRKAANSDPFVDPANDYASLLDDHPSSFEQVSQPDASFPALSRSFPTTPPRKTKPTKTSASATHLPALRNLPFNKEQPPLPPLPPFIAPLPATKQRYVSAGGNAPLHERAEIKGPAFTATAFDSTVNTASGRALRKDEVDAKLNDDDWVKENFGIVPHKSSSPPDNEKGRGSDETSASEFVGSQRTSKEHERRPRSRKGSGVAVLKRVFSRNQSETNFI